ncbi:MAG: ABC transporter permease [SAR324 cluster bacterium]|nr:ABC transporter permease [SAR324 cluster bacterium]
MYIGLRYLLSRRKDRSISFITWISIGGVMLGVVALIVSTSMMNGFRDNLRKSILGALPQVTVFGGAAESTEIEALAEQIAQHPEVLHTAPYIYKQAMLAGETLPKGALIRGIDPEREIHVTEIGSFLRDEVYPLEAPSLEEQALISKRILSRLSYTRSQKNKQKAGIILGAALAQGLGVVPGDRVKLISSETKMTPVGDVPRAKELEVIGIFELGISGYDEVLAFVDYKLVQRIYNMKDSVTGIGVNISDPEIAPIVAAELQDSLNASGRQDFYLVSNWASENKNIFRLMKLEKLALFVGLTLIVLVAAFNIISSITMMVLEKTKDIAILKSLGATDRSVLSIFMLQGVLIGICGTAFGVFLGLSICWVLINFNIVDIPPGVYPGGNRVPMSIVWQEIGITAFISFLICFLVTIIPALKAARIEPAQALQYE